MKKRVNQTPSRPIFGAALSGFGLTFVLITIPRAGAAQSTGAGMPTPAPPASNDGAAPPRPAPPAVAPEAPGPPTPPAAAAAAPDSMPASGGPPPATPAGGFSPPGCYPIPPGYAPIPGYVPSPAPSGLVCPPGYYALRPNYAAPPTPYLPASGPGTYPQIVYPPGGYPSGGPNGLYSSNPSHPFQGPGAETHDGFYLRMQLGASSNTFTAKSGANTVQFSGGGGSFNIALGYSLTPHLVVYGELLLAGAADDTGQIILNGVSQGQNDVENNLVGIGPGAAYYLPWNFFVATSFLLANCYETEGGGSVTVNSKEGFALAGALTRSDDGTAISRAVYRATRT